VFSRSTEVYLYELPRATTWFEGNNGGHTQCVIPNGLLLKFFDRYVKGIHNGFDSTPHIILQHEVNGSTPAWTSYINDWADTVQPLRLYLHSGGLLNLTAPTGTEAADMYNYPTPSPSDATWQDTYDAPDGSVSYTTPALTRDAEFFGPGSVDMWLSSTATDTDVQVTVSEVRPDGQEQYIQRGWLRMSHRKLDPVKSTVLRPFHTDLAADSEPLTPGQATFARLEIWPFDHVFRKGSSIRITFDTPASYLYTFSGFQFLPNPAQNAVYHDPWHVSSVVLPLIPGASAGAPLPACGNVTDEPCRTNMTPVPAGSLTIP
jgi:putative CocE/NonD family hydrolase